MMARGVSVLAVWLLAFLVLGGGAPAVGAPSGQPEALAQGPTQVAFLQAPLSFEVNRGQTAAQVKYLSRGPGHTLFLTPGEVVLALQRDRQARRDPGPSQPGAVLRLRLVGANPAPRVEGLEPLPGKANYFIGNDPTKWRANIPTYAKVNYQAVYPGVNLVYYGTNQRQLEYDFVVAPGANPKAIRLAFTGVDRLNIDAHGDLILHTAGGEVLQHAPKVYQAINGIKQSVAGRYVLYGKDQVGFRVASYDRTRPLVIDPTLSLSYSTYLGGSSFSQGLGIAVDSSGHAYVTGSTGSADFPATPGSGAFQPSPGFIGGSDDAFVAKFDPTGSTLLYATYLGGSSSENGAAIAVDAAGHAYVTGRTQSNNFPTFNPYQGAFGGSFDAFVAKLDPTGSALLYSTYLGGSLFDEGKGIAVDAAGIAYVAGRTRSNNFPTFNFYQGALNGGFDVFVAKLDPTQAGALSLVYSTYLGGGGDDSGIGIAVDAAGIAYVAGTTLSAPSSPPLFPRTTNALTSPSLGVNDGTGGDAFVAKLDPTKAGTPSLLYSTYLGGNGADSGAGIAVDSTGNAYVTGATDSTNFPTTPATAFQTFNGGFRDAFMAKLQLLPTSSTLLYSTYLGGLGDDFAAGIAVDSTGNAYVAGATVSLNYPTANRLTSSAGVNDGTGGDVFVAKLDPTQAGALSLLYSTYLGGNGFDQGLAIAADKTTGDAYVTGSTFSINFPRVNSLTSPSPGVNDGTGGDAFVAKLSFSSAGGGPGGGGTFSLTAIVAGSGTGTVTSSPAGINCPGICSTMVASGATVTLTAAPTGGSTFSWGGDCAFAGMGTTCTLTMDAVKSVTATFSAAGGGGESGCNMVGHVHGNQNYKATISGKKVNVHVEVDGDCDYDKKANKVFLHHAMVHVVVGGGPPLINAKQHSNGKHTDVKSVTLSPGPPPATGTPTAIVEGIYDAIPFKVTLTDGGKRDKDDDHDRCDKDDDRDRRDTHGKRDKDDDKCGKGDGGGKWDKDDTIVVVTPVLPAPIAGSAPHNNVHIDFK